MEQPATALGSPLVADEQAGGGELLWLREPTAGFRVGVARACGALVAEGDRLLAVRRYQRAYVLVVRADTVMAVIAAHSGPATSASGQPGRPPHLRPYGGTSRRE